MTIAVYPGTFDPITSGHEDLMRRAAKLYDMDTIVRVNKGGYSEYVKPFECDATGIMVPHITSADEARSVVDMVRCRPMGSKALDAGNMALVAILSVILVIH